jgi:hypothetical protein
MSIDLNIVASTICSAALSTTAPLKQHRRTGERSE